MKKTLVAALTTAMVVGAASTTFAAANPFSDVPAGHWAYDYVSQLAADGVIEGYGDTTFQGDKNITRYEMATMIAKAMAKTNVSGTDKAMLDKLAAEFSDELNNLGVRVANLERNADKVKWNGKIEGTATSFRDKDYSESGYTRHGEHGRTNDYNWLFRLEPSAEVNSNWHVNARLDAATKLNTDAGDANGSDKVTLKRIWAQGDYTNFQVKAGKFAPIDDDLIADTQFSGGQVGYTNNGWTLAAGAGRISDDDAYTLMGDNGRYYKGEDAANYQFYGVDYRLNKFYGAAHFHHANANNWKYKDGNKTTDQADIWLLRGAYRFNKNVAFNGFYAENHDADVFEKAGSAEVDYKGAEKLNRGTWGAWLAYRHLGQNAIVKSTFDVVRPNQKAWEIGANYTVFPNVVTTVRYGAGEELNYGHHDVENLFGRVEFFF